MNPEWRRGDSQFTVAGLVFLKDACAESRVLDRWETSQPIGRLTIRYLGVHSASFGHHHIRPA